MDILAGSVPAGLCLTGGMDPGMNTSIFNEFMKSKYVRFVRQMINLFSLIMQNQKIFFSNIDPLIKFLTFFLF